MQTICDKWVYTDIKRLYGVYEKVVDVSGGGAKGGLDFGKVEGILEQVYLALKEKGYIPVNQIVGYIMSGDPTYITSHNNARSLIMKVERDELVEEVIKYFIEGKGL